MSIRTHETTYQNSCKSLINTCYSIGHRLEYFHFARFCSMSIEADDDRAAHQPQKGENWKLEIEDKSSRSSYGWLVSNTKDDCLQRQIAKKIFKSKIEALPVNAGHYMAFKHRVSFATNLAAKQCKLWLQSIQNHARHRFNAFARVHLKSLCCSIRIWTDALFLDRSSISTCCFAQDSIWNMLFCSDVIFLLRDEWMIKRLSEASGRQQLLW